MNPEQIERALLWNSLCNLGHTAKLKFSFEPKTTLDRLEEFKENWCPYNVKKDLHNNRWGLPITSHTGDVMDNYHLNSFGYMQKYHDVEMREENFTKFTPVYNKLKGIGNIVDTFAPDIGRVHLLRVDQGGYFPPHRDFVNPSPEYVRLLAVFGRSMPDNYAHILDGKLFYPDPGCLYFVNFQLDHSVFSFTDGLYALILTVKLNCRTYDIITDNLISE
jgi:hypothetical protein